MIGIFLRRAALLVAAATLGSLGSVSGRAEPPISRKTEIALISSAASSNRPDCVVQRDKARFDYPLVRTSRRLAEGVPIKIVALGSSSTYGAGGSTSAASYPSRLAAELAQSFPNNDITVLNRGVNGDEAADMLARLDRDVLSEKPDLILWQVGTNSVIRDQILQPQLLREGLLRMKAIGADVILIDPQYAPKVISKPNANDMVSLIATTAKAEHVGVFHRFAVMRQWHEEQHLSFESFISPDGLHMNDWSYACLGRWIGMAIVEAGTRPIATAAIGSVLH